MSDDKGDNKSAPRRLVGRPFEKGKSGNPGGRPREIQEIVDLARTNSVGCRELSAVSAFETAGGFRVGRISGSS